MSTTDNVVKVFVVDESELIRIGVAAIVDNEQDISIVGEAGSMAQAIARIPALRPDLAVLGVHLPDGDGVALCRVLKVKLPALNCLVFGGEHEAEMTVDAFLAGASGFILKNVGASALVDAIRSAAAGSSLLDAVAIGVLLDRVRLGGTPPGPLDELTEQERFTLDLIGEGLSNRQIGERMFVADKTVKNYVSRIFSKLGLQSRSQAAVLITQINDGRAVE